MTTENLILLTMFLPALAGILCLFLREKKGMKEGVTVVTTLVNLIVAIMLFQAVKGLPGKQLLFTAFHWAGAVLGRGYPVDFNLDFRLYHFSSFIVLATAGFAFLIALYSMSFMKDKPARNQYYAYFLFTLTLVNGAVLSNNLVGMLFFWEGLLLTLFGLIYIGHKGAYPTAVKAFVIAGVADFCMLAGIALTGVIAGTFTMTDIMARGGIPLTTWPTAVAFVLIMIGAVAKAGSMPFHSWIPDSAIDAPLPFMAYVPASLEKLLGIYFLSRITLDLFKLQEHSWLSYLLMILGAATILLAVLMALIQTDYKRLLSYHAISQVGYMILGVGTAIPAGIIGGIFHMINHAMYKSCLFLTGGSVEKQAGTTDLHKLGGLSVKMPVTFWCFVIAACSISGVPPFNGFFSKELVYDGAFERGWYFYAAALLGSFLTAASFLKLGHAAYRDPLPQDKATAKDPSIWMQIPMIVIAALCVVFGLWNALPLQNLIQPILTEAGIEFHDFSGFHVNWMWGATLIVLGLAYANHMYGVKKSGKGVGASDHIHYAPVLHPIYNLAEQRYFDPYNIGVVIVQGLAFVASLIDKAVDWIYEGFTVWLANVTSAYARGFQNGNYSSYIGWSIAGTLLIIIFFILK